MRFFLSLLLSFSIVTGLFAQNGVVLVPTPIGDSGVSLDLPETGLDYDSISLNGWKLHFIYAYFQRSDQPIRLGAMVRQPDAGRQADPLDEDELRVLMDNTKGMLAVVEDCPGYAKETMPNHPGMLVLSNLWPSEEPNEFTGKQITYEVKGMDREGTFVLLFAEQPSNAQDRYVLEVFFKSVRL